MGGVAQDNRRFINAVLDFANRSALARFTGGLWRLEKYAPALCRWRDAGRWEKLLEQLIVEPDYEWLMIDASHIKAHPHAAGAEGGNQDMGRTKGLNTKLHLPWMRTVCLVRVLITSGTDADCTHADRLIEGIDAEHLLADKGDDSDAIVTQARKRGMQPQIPPREKSKGNAPDKHLYKFRHLVENAFCILRWRGIATRYAKIDTAKSEQPNAVVFI